MSICNSKLANFTFEGNGKDYLCGSHTHFFINILNTKDYHVVRNE